MGKIFAPDFSGHQATSKSGITEATRLFADKADNFYGRLEDYFLLFEGSDRLECRDDAQCAVELSPVDDCVQVRTYEEGRGFRVGTIEPAENIANPIDVNLQADLPHLVNKKLTAAQLFD